MKVTTLDTPVAEQIGHAFGYYDYGEEVGMGAFYRSKDAVATYIAGYVRMAFEGGMLYTISERGEGYIAYKVPGQKLKLRAGMQLVKALFRSMSLKELIRMGQGVSKGGTSLQDRMKKEKKPYIFVGMVCVPEQYQGQGYMRKVPTQKATGCRFRCFWRPMRSQNATNTCTLACSLTVYVI